MAIFHLTIKPLARRAGRSAVAAAAYRAGVRLVDERTAIVHDFRRRRGVLARQLIAPAHAPAWAGDRARLWSAAELCEVRSDARTAREIEVALPAELNSEQRLSLACQLAREIVYKHCVAIDVAIHAPSARGDARNFHAHLLFTTRRVDATGFAAKTREFDDRKQGPALVQWWRERWSELCNRALQLAGRPERIDHRSHAARGIDRTPVNLTRDAVEIERRTNRPSGERVATIGRAESIREMRMAYDNARRAAACARHELAAELNEIVAIPEAPNSLAGIAARNQAAGKRAQGGKAGSVIKGRGTDANEVAP